jgi:hypothetical protein
MHADYPDHMTLREARARYFADNGFGESGGYDEPWVDFKIGSVPMPFPNTKQRVRAVRYHDLHHVLTGYETDFVGELEISAWEIAAGCKSFAAAWVLNLGGIAAGVVRAPRRTFAAFVRGRRHRTLYGEDLDRLLEETLGEARARVVPEATDGRARARDVALFAVAAALGVGVGALTFALALPLLPFGLAAQRLQKRSPV